MKKITKHLVSATVATGILFGTITMIEPKQVQASEVNSNIYTANKDLANWMVEVQLAQKEYNKAETEYEKMMDYADAAESKTINAYEDYQKAQKLFEKESTAKNKENVQSTYKVYQQLLKQDNTAYNAMVSYGEKYAAAQDKLENAKTNLTKAQKLVDLLKNYQEVPTPQVTVIHEIEKVAETPSTNTNVSSTNTEQNKFSVSKGSSEKTTPPKVSTNLKQQIESLKNGKALNLKGKSYVATLKAKHPLFMVRIVKAKRVKLAIKVKPYRLYKVKAIKRINNQIWVELSSKNEWINIKYLTFFKKID